MGEAKRRREHKAANAPQRAADLAARRARFAEIEAGYSAADDMEDALTEQPTEVTPTKTLYGVVHQDFENNGTQCLFEDEADAKAHAAELNVGYSQYGVEPFVVYPPGYRPGRHTYWNGYALGLGSPHVSRRDAWEYDHELGVPPPAEPTVTIDSYRGVVRIVVFGADRDSVTAKLHEALDETRGPGWNVPHPAMPALSCYSRAGFNVHVRGCWCKDR